MPAFCVPCSILPNPLGPPVRGKICPASRGVILVLFRLSGYGLLFFSLKVIILEWIHYCFFYYFSNMKIITIHSFIKTVGLLVVAAMLGTACSAVDPEESDSQENDNGKSEKIPTPDSYKYPIPEAVDLGLSVKWASINLFADEPYSVRGHLAWGGFYNTVFSWSHYRLCEGSKITLTRYNSEKEYGKVDNKKEFKDYNYEDDAARAYLGGNWHIPTERNSGIQLASKVFIYAQ